MLLVFFVVVFFAGAFLRQCLSFTEHAHHVCPNSHSHALLTDNRSKTPSQVLQRLLTHIHKSPKQEREGYEGEAEQVDGQQAHHWQAACDAKSDKHRRHREAEEARRKAGMLARRRSKVLNRRRAAPDFDLNFVWR